MIIRVYSEDDKDWDYKVYRIPNRVEYINLQIKKDPTNDGLGNIEINWHSQKETDNYDLEYNCETLYFGKLKNYVTVDDKKFVLEDTNDLIELYQYLSGEDVNKFVKDFKSLEKEFSASKDFT